MLKIKSFHIKEDEAINEFLNKYPRANGGTVFISDGNIAIPYEDGEVDTKEVLIIRKKQEIAALKENRAINVTSLLVDEEQLKSIQQEVADIEGKITVLGGSKESYDNNKELERKIEGLNKFASDIKESIRRHKSEINRLDINIVVHERQLSDIK